MCHPHKKYELSEFARQSLVERNKRRCGGKTYYHIYPPEKAEKMIESRSGENSPTWKGGLSFEPYLLSWKNNLREKVRNRDGRKCQLCGLSETEKRRLDVHHIDYDKKNLDPYLLISLCVSCHTKTNFNRPHWQQILKEKITDKYSSKQITVEENKNAVACELSV